MWQCEEIIARCQLEIDTVNCGLVASVAWLEKKRAAKARMGILQTIYDELLAEWQTQYSSTSWLFRKGPSWQGLGEFDPTDYGPPPASADPQTSDTSTSADPQTAGLSAGASSSSGADYQNAGLPANL